MSELKVCVLQAEELATDLEDKHIMDISDEEFHEMAKKKDSVYSLVNFQYKFNWQQIDCCSENSYIRIIECSK